jgi:hypothetical protein
MPSLTNILELNRCPHCNVDHPSLPSIFNTRTNAHSGDNERFWGIYNCTRCGGLITAASPQENGVINEYYPSGDEIDDSVPGAAREYLSQAIQTIFAPAGSVMLSARSVDVMLKEKGYTEGSLYTRINKAAEEHLITNEMARWADEIRLDANDPKHADAQVSLPTEDDARNCVEFATALAQFLFVLPARVQRGLADTEQG